MNWRELVKASAPPRHRLDEDDELDREILAVKLVPTHCAGMSTVQATVKCSVGWLAGQNIQGAIYGQLEEQATAATTYNIGTAAANNTTGGADEQFSFQQAITAGNSATFNLNAMTNILQQANTSIARVKSWQIRLLSLANDSTINSNTNTNSTITVTNNGPATPAQLNFGSKGSGLTLNVTNAANGAINTVAINAAGSGYLPSWTGTFTVNQLGASGAVISATTNAGGVPTSASIINGGTGYNGVNNMATTELGSFSLQTGSAMLLVDVSPLGASITANACNIKVYNNDQNNPVTPEITVTGATT